MIVISYVALAMAVIVAAVRIWDMAALFRTAKKYDNKVKLKKASYKREISNLIMAACWVLICVSRYFQYVKDHYYYTTYLKNYDGHYADLIKVNLLLAIAFSIALLIDISYLVFGRYSFLTPDGMIRSDAAVFGSKIFLKKEKFTCKVESSELDVYIGKSDNPIKYIILDNKGTSDMLNMYDKATFDKLEKYRVKINVDF